MFSHITLGTNDWTLARPFWVAIMEVLGHPVMFEREGGIAFGTPTGPKTFVGPTFDRNPAVPGNGVHIAYTVARAKVDALLCRGTGQRRHRRGRSRTAPALSSDLLRCLRA